MDLTPAPKSKWRSRKYAQWSGNFPEQLHIHSTRRNLGFYWMIGSKKSSIAKLRNHLPLQDLFHSYHFLSRFPPLISSLQCQLSCMELLLKGLEPQRDAGNSPRQRYLVTVAYVRKTTPPKKNDKCYSFYMHIICIGIFIYV